MKNQWLIRLLSLGVIAWCFHIGINFGTVIRSGQAQTLGDSVNTSNPKEKQIPQSIPQETVAPDSVLPTEADNINQENTITIQAVGDVIPGTNYPDNRLPRNKQHLIPQSVRRFLQRADILFGNFETSLTNNPNTAKDTSRGQVFAFRSPPAYAKLFSDVGFDVFNIANNHALDFGWVGFRDTVKNLKSQGIETLGHKNQILLLESNNIPIAMIGFAPYQMYNSIHDLETAKALIQQARQKADIVIVSMHAGAEGTAALRTQNKTEFFYGENRGNSVQFARNMIDAGADLVLGHGPHVPRAVEVYKGKLIAYSLGNFLGYRTLSTVAETGYSMILEVKLNQKGDLVKGKIIPVRLDKQGIPYIDNKFRTVALLRNLIQKDFPNTVVEFDNNGYILVKQ